jgi:hypothetical protein
MSWGLSFLLHRYGGWTVICHPPSRRRRIPSNFGRAEHQQPTTTRSATVAGIPGGQWRGNNVVVTARLTFVISAGRSDLPKPGQKPISTYGTGMARFAARRCSRLGRHHPTCSPNSPSRHQPNPTHQSPPPQFSKLSLPLLTSIHHSTKNSFTTRSSPDITPQ